MDTNYVCFQEENIEIGFGKLYSLTIFIWSIIHWFCALFAVHKLFFHRENKSTQTALRLLQSIEKICKCYIYCKYYPYVYINSIFFHHITFILNTIETEKIGYKGCLQGRCLSEE